MDRFKIMKKTAGRTSHIELRHMSAQIRSRSCRGLVERQTNDSLEMGSHPRCCEAVISLLRGCDIIVPRCCQAVIYIRYYC